MLECRYNGNCSVMYHRPFDSDEIPCDGYDGDTCSLYQPMPDVKALEWLANEIDGAISDGLPYGSYEPYRWQRIIRESLGKVD